MSIDKSIEASVRVPWDAIVRAVEQITTEHRDFTQYDEDTLRIAWKRVYVKRKHEALRAIAQKSKPEADAWLSNCEKHIFDELVRVAAPLGMEFPPVVRAAVIKDLYSSDMSNLRLFNMLGIHGVGYSSAQLSEISAAITRAYSKLQVLRGQDKTAKQSNLKAVLTVEEMQLYAELCATLPNETIQDVDAWLVKNILAKVKQGSVSVPGFLRSLGINSDIVPTSEREALYRALVHAHAKHMDASSVKADKPELSAEDDTTLPSEPEEEQTTLKDSERCLFSGLCAVLKVSESHYNSAMAARVLAAVKKTPLTVEAVLKELGVSNHRVVDFDTAKAHSTILVLHDILNSDRKDRPEARQATRLSRPTQVVTRDVPSKLTKLEQKVWADLSGCLLSPISPVLRRHTPVKRKVIDSIRAGSATAKEVLHELGLAQSEWSKSDCEEINLALKRLRKELNKA